MNVEFDPKGILTQIQNNVTSTRGFKRNVPARHVFEQIVGKPKIVGQIKSAPPPLVNDSIEPSGHANFMCDCMKEELGTDIALFGSATIRGYFEAGNLDTRWLEDISPFKNKMAVCDYSEKQIVDALRVSARSMVNTNNKPGILHVSGLKYTISKDGQLKSASFVNKEDIDYLREKNPDILIWAIEPEHAAILSGGTVGTHIQMGIGDGVIPEILNQKIYDHVITVTDEEALETARELARKEGLMCGISSGTSVAGAIVVTYGMKYLADRKRPYERYPGRVHPYSTEHSPSFPSGHTATAFALATSLSMKYPKWYVIAPTALWACSVGMSRMNEGVHYPSDVLVGAAVGAGCAVANHYINRWLNRWLFGSR